MILKVFERLLNIDDIEYKWAVRLMFLVCIIARCAVFFNPYTDTNFSWLNSWMAAFEAATEIVLEKACERVDARDADGTVPVFVEPTPAVRQPEPTPALSAPAKPESTMPLPAALASEVDDDQA